MVFLYIQSYLRRSNESIDVTETFGMCVSAMEGKPEKKIVEWLPSCPTLLRILTLPKNLGLQLSKVSMGME